MKFRLRTLLILLADLPPLGAVGYWKAERYVRHQAAQRRLGAALDIGLQEWFRVWRELIDRGQLD